MKFINWLKAKKQKSKELRRQQKEEQQAIERGPIMPKDEVQQLSADDPSAVPPETRYTPEYQEFLKNQEAAKANGENKPEES